MRKNELDKINDKMGLIEETLKDEVPKISMPIFSYEAKEERHAKEKRTLMKIIVFLITVIFAIVCGFLVYLNQYDFSVDDTTVEASQSGGDMSYGNADGYAGIKGKSFDRLQVRVAKN